jgi:hypothetical protein
MFRGLCPGDRNSAHWGRLWDTACPRRTERRQRPIESRVAEPRLL